MTAISTVACPKCAAELVIEAINPGERIQCAKCRNQFHLQSDVFATAATETGTSEAATLEVATRSSGPAAFSGWANAARILGILSILPLFGLAALLAGALGLRDIRRRPPRQGTGRAVFGIVVGSVTTFGWAFIAAMVVSMMFYVRQTRTTFDASEIAAFGTQIGSYNIPPALQPIRAKQFVPGMRMVMYGDRYRTKSPKSGSGESRKADVTLVLMRFPKALTGQRQSMERWLRRPFQQTRKFRNVGIKVESTRQLTYHVRGEAVQVTERTGVDPTTGNRRREYTAFFSHEDTHIGVIIITGDEPVEETAGSASEIGKANLTEAEVREFFASFE